MNFLKWFSKKAPINELTVAVVPGVKRGLLKWKERPNPPPEVMPPLPPLTDGELVEAMKLFRSGIHWLKRLAGESWTRIAPVQCPTPFAGWGYVTGRTYGMRINRHIVLVEADDDYDFSEVCVLIDGVPTLLLEERRGDLRVTIIAGQDYIKEVLNPSAVTCSVPDDYKALPEPLRKIMHDIFAKVYALEMAKPDAVEAMLEYAGRLNPEITPQERRLLQRQRADMQRRLAERES